MQNVVPDDNLTLGTVLSAVNHCLCTGCNKVHRIGASGLLHLLWEHFVECAVFDSGVVKT